MTLARFHPGRVAQWLRRRLLHACLLGLLAPVSAFPAVLAAPEAHSVRTVVEAQLDAFADNDAERAFSYASAAIRAQFGDAATFMAMVQRGYPMVVRPAAVTFFQPQLDEPAGGADGSDTTVRQAVQLRDGAGRLWLATYVLQRQAGTGWRIDGCVVQADDGKSSS